MPDQYQDFGLVWKLDFHGVVFCCIIDVLYQMDQRALCTASFCCIPGLFIFWDWPWSCASQYFCRNKVVRITLKLDIGGIHGEYSMGVSYSSGATSNEHGSTMKG